VGGTGLKLFERHKNGATFEVDADSTLAAKMVVEWREYQDMKESVRRPSGFVPKEEDAGD
jgi:hypothetical protein